VEDSAANSSSGLNKLPLVGLIFVAVLVGTLIGLKTLTSEEPQPIPESLVEYLLWEPLEVTPFTLVDFNNQEYGIDRLSGYWTFIFFGYTFCPDICPVTLSNLVSVFRKLESRSFPMSQVQVIFVSVDPGRDTPAVLKQYVPYFDSRFMGSTGSKTQLDLFTRQLGALYYIDEQIDEQIDINEQVDGENPGENYTVSHNSSLFLIDPQARQFARFAMPHLPDEITDAFVRIVQHYESAEGKDSTWF
jgi:protein SCO1/2